MLELDFEHMVLRRDGEPIAPLFEQHTYTKADANSLHLAAEARGRRLTDAEARAVIAARVVS